MTLNLLVDLMYMRSVCYPLISDSLTHQTTTFHFSMHPSFTQLSFFLLSLCCKSNLPPSLPLTPPFSSTPSPFLYCLYDPASCSCPRPCNSSPMGVLFRPMLSSLFSSLFFKLRSLTDAWMRITVNQTKVLDLFSQHFRGRW